MLRSAADHSFHRISVDGDTSTNDAVFALASGKAGALPVELVEDAMKAVARRLAIMIVRDGEGATKLIQLHVKGARNSPEALAVGRTVAGSLLVRTAVAGGNLNWGRLIAAVGRSGVELDPRRVELRAGGVTLFAAGRPIGSPVNDDFNPFQGSCIQIEINLNQGCAAEEFFTCDLTEDYVRINADRMT